jgi:hypothetical protein
VLLIVCLVLFQDQLGSPLSASGRNVPAIIDALASGLSGPVKAMLDQCKVDVVRVVSAKPGAAESLVEANQRLQEALPRLRAMVTGAASDESDASNR